MGHSHDFVALQNVCLFSSTMPVHSIKMATEQREVSTMHVGAMLVNTVHTKSHFTVSHT